ncbi:MAG: response regulator transcription factor [Saccharofermentans sp.]|nr:response regulator transcription factor [Saccharofermentans sp.]
MKKIFIIEDDQEIQNVLGILLKGNGFDVVRAYSGTEGLLVDISDVDLILLDLMLPGRRGQDIIGELKAKKDIPIIVMSAVNDISAKVDLFALGADDYVTKPFHNDELLARISARLRTTGGAGGKDERTIRIKKLEVRPDDWEAYVDGNLLDLSKQEFELLCLLAENGGKTCTKSMIFEKAWHYDSEADDNTINVHISKVRKKLKEYDPDTDYIETVWGIGYRMKTGN